MKGKLCKTITSCAMEVNRFTGEEKYPHLMFIKLKIIGSNMFDIASLSVLGSG